MSDNNAQPHSENMLISYRTILLLQGLGWIVSSNQKVAVQRVPSYISPASPHCRLKFDLGFFHNDVKKNFTSVMEHGVKLSEEVQLVDNCSKQPFTCSSDLASQFKDSAISMMPDNHGSKANSKNGKRTTKIAPCCFYAPCHSKVIHHWPDDCISCSKNLKPRVRATHVA